MTEIICSEGELYSRFFSIALQREGVSWSTGDAKCEGLLRRESSFRKGCESNLNLETFVLFDCTVFREDLHKREVLR